MQSFPQWPIRIHDVLPGAPGILTPTRALDIFFAMKFSKKNLVDMVIFMGLLINLVVITLIIYFYVV